MVLTCATAACMLATMIEKDSTTVPALKRMAEWLTDSRSQGWLSQTLGVSRPTVYRWVHGEHAPDAHYRRAIHDLSKGYVHFDDWYTDEQLAAAYRWSRTRRRRLQRRKVNAEES